MDMNEVWKAEEKEWSKDLFELNFDIIENSILWFTKILNKTLWIGGAIVVLLLLFY